MSQHLQHPVEYFYDSHPTEDDLMGQTSFHAHLVRYLLDVLEWHSHRQTCAIYKNFNFYQTPNPMEYPLDPDIAVIKGTPFRHGRSWTVGRTGPAPHVIFEILMEEIWLRDLKEHPCRYAHMGVEEYFAYDPNEPPLAPETAHRLFGWRLDRPQGQMVRLPLDAQGRLWSQQLGCWLVPDGTMLRLADDQYQVWLTEAEAEARRAGAEAKAREAETMRAEAEAKAREAETMRAEAEAQRAKALAEKLRSLGINPDEL